MTPSKSSKPKPRMPNRAIRVREDLWRRALARAEERDEPLSEAIRRFLERYAAGEE